MMINTINYKMNMESISEPAMQNEDIPVIKLKHQTKQELIESRHLKLLLSSPELQKK